MIVLLEIGSKYIPHYCHTDIAVILNRKFDLIDYNQSFFHSRSPTESELLRNILVRKNLSGIHIRKKSLLQMSKFQPDFRFHHN